MKLAAPDNPVHFSWLADQGYRLDVSPYLSGGYQARKLLDRLPRTQPLGAVTRRPNGIFHAGRVSRRWVTDPDHGVPFFSSTDILEADFSYLPLIARSAMTENPQLRIERDWILVTRSGTVGRIAYARRDIDGFACSEHVLRVVPDFDHIPAGYLYTFLRSQYGLPMITGAAYGAIIQHIEPHHIADLPVPRLGEEVEGQIHELIVRAAELRTRFQAGVRAATRDLFTSAGLPELADLHWHQLPPALGFAVPRISATSLRALNYDIRVKQITDRIQSVSHRTLGDICDGGELQRGNRFKRVPAEIGQGHQMVGQRQIFWLRPEGRWIALKPIEARNLQTPSESIMVASQGLLTDGALIGRAAFVSDSWSQKYIYSEHLLRVQSGDPSVSGAYLYAFMRSEASFRIMRSLCAGTGPQDINSVLRRQVPVPVCAAGDRERIAGTVRQAYRDRDEADTAEDEALRLLDVAVRAAAG